MSDDNTYPILFQQFQVMPGADMLVIFALDTDGLMWEGLLSCDAWDRSDYSTVRWRKFPMPRKASVK